MIDDEIEKQVKAYAERFKKTRLFSVDKSSVDNEQAQRFCNLLNEIDNTCFSFEPTPPDEPIGEIYRDGKLIGYLM